jgi:microcompartment protein CcmL/EutN
MSVEQGGPALGMIELGSIARGVVVADALVKRAAARLLMARPVSSGKHLILLRGEVAEVGESMSAALAAAGAALVDRLELAMADEQLWRLLPDPAAPADWGADEGAEAVAVVETATVCASIAAADAAVKTAPVILRDLRLAAGIGGKAFFTLTGLLADVEAAADAARAVADDRLVGLEIIAAPAPELRGRLVF